MFKVPNKARIRPSDVPSGEAASLGSNDDIGNNGAFALSFMNNKFMCIASDGEGWEHVSISVYGQRRTPNWREMCHFKELFWSAEDCVVQYHPSAKDYINTHEYCLHLWRPTDIELPRPHKGLI